MINKLVQWILSKLYPYTKPATAVYEYTCDEAWDRRKRCENEEFYGRQDGWRC